MTFDQQWAVLARLEETWQVPDTARGLLRSHKQRTARVDQRGLAVSMAIDVSIWTGAASSTARDLEAYGHRSPNQLPPKQLRDLVARGLR